jgi:2-oxoglutarate ferredoxin oxidoreductase subunit delta
MAICPLLHDCIKKNAIFVKQHTACYAANKGIINQVVMAKGTIVIDTEKCKGCAVCTTGCPCNVIILSKKVNSKGYNYLEMQNDACIGCANCAILCPDGVITVYREK